MIVEFAVKPQDMENIFGGFQYYCPKDLAMYLGSVGNVTDYTDHLAYFNIQSRSNQLRRTVRVAQLRARKRRRRISGAVIVLDITN